MIRRPHSRALLALAVLCLNALGVLSCTDEVGAPPADGQASADQASLDASNDVNADVSADRGADTSGDVTRDVTGDVPAVPDGCTQCTKDDQCDDGNVCTKDTCSAAKCCKSTPAPAGGSCDDKDLCTKQDACDGKGKCAGTLFTCTPGSCEASATCDGKGGCITTHKPAATVCDDKSACTSGDGCDGKGKCVGTLYACVPGKCEATSVCDGKGGCAYTFLTSGAVCDDGNACSKGDACDGKGGCAGTPYACAPKQCEAASVCDGKGGCLATPKPATTSCVDGDPCTKNDACDGKGACAGSKYSCAAGQCETSSACDGKGGCAATFKASGVGCDDKDICTSSDACDGKGACKGTSCGSKDGYQNTYQCAAHAVQRAFRIHKCTGTGCTYKDIWKTQATCARTCSSWCNSGATTCGNAPAGALSPSQGCVCDGKGACKVNTLKQSLVAYWRLDDNKGSTATDSSGNNNHGTLKYPAWTSGKANIALDFAGKDVVACGNGASFGAMKTQLSLAAWFRFDVDPYSITQSRSYIIDKGWAWRLWYSASGEGSTTSDQLFLDIWDWQGVVTTGITWKKGTWYHVVATYDGAHARVFINGKLNNSKAVSKKLRTSSYNVLLGADSEYGGSKYYWNGVLDEVAVWSRALSASEASGLYQVNGVIK